jgi:uncharacterized protein (DUF1499 family)
VRRMLMRAIKLFAIVLILLSLALVAIGQAGGFRGSPPATSGPVAGRPAACPPTPNCVSSQSVEPARRVDPLPARASAPHSMRELRQALARLPGATIVDARPDHLRVEVRTTLLGFVDDLELLVDDASQVVHVRSASRIGHSDMGTNRRRIERLRALMLDAADEAP